ncbi:coenzyme F420-0:L-glutamate ligase [Erysipelothrix sp. D19-032]
MGRKVGTVSRGIRGPIIREGDDLASIVTQSILEASKSDNFEVRDRDIIAMTESIVARAQGNYANVDAIAKDIRTKFGTDTIGVIFPILSRNRFSMLLKGVAQGVKKVVLMLSFPSDEVGNELVTLDQLDEAGVNPYSDVLTLEQYRALFGENKHSFTGVDYVAYYGEIIEAKVPEVEIIFSNRRETILNYTKHVLACDIHSRARTKRILKREGASLYLVWTIS